MQPAFWMNRDRIGAAFSRLTGLRFLVSSTPVEELVERASDVVYKEVGTSYRYLPKYTLSDYFPQYAPAEGMTDPVRVTADPNGHLCVEWASDADNILYPRVAGNGKDEKVRSFVLILGETNTDSFLSQGSTNYSNGIANSRPLPRLMVSGTLGEKGSGADLELEGIESWRAGEPLYLPKGRLIFPLELIYGLSGELPVPAPDARYTSLEKSGPNRTVTAIGTNGLAVDSVLAQNVSGGEALYKGLFSGSGSSVWEVHYARQLLQISFPQPVTGIMGFGITLEAGATGAGEVEVYTSAQDGVITPLAIADNRSSDGGGTLIVPFDPEIPVKHLRFVASADSNDTPLQITGLEAYQVGSWA